jgi:hypothetical protein
MDEEAGMGYTRALRPSRQTEAGMEHEPAHGPTRQSKGGSECKLALRPSTLSKAGAGWPHKRVYEAKGKEGLEALGG